MVAESLERALSHTAHLEPCNRPGQGAVGVRTRWEGNRQVGEPLGLVLAEQVAAGSRRGCSGRNPAPMPGSARREGIGPEAEAAALEDAHDADQLPQLVQGARGGIRAIALLGDGEELRLPG